MAGKTDDGEMEAGCAVIGVDSCRDGWVAVELRDGRFHRATISPAFRAILDAHPDVAVIAVDIPIGLHEHGLRTCDQAARAFVGPRRSSVFPTPIRAALTASTYELARAMCKERGERGLSSQAWELRRKILDVDGELCDDDHVFEIHPEVCFCAMAGRPLWTRKVTWSGMWERLALLREQGVVIPSQAGDAGAAAPDDVLDAAAAAWSAHRIANGQARYVSEPEVDAQGRRVTIWY